MDDFKDRKLVVAFSGNFKRQTAFGTPLTTADINTRHPQNTKVFPGRIITREETRDCTGEYVIKEEITSRLTRLNFQYDATPWLVAGWLAYGMGAAAAPSGTQTAEVWNFTTTGTLTAGSLIVSHTFEGLTDTVEIPYNASAADIKRLLETLRTIKTGNITSVTGTFLSGPVVITLGGKLAAGNITEPTINSAGLTGGTVAPSTTTPGASKTALISRTSSDQTPLFSLIVGFDGDTTNPDKYKDMVVNTVTIRGALRGKVTVDLELIGSNDLIEIIGYSMPACVNQDPVYTRDCRIQVDGDFVSEKLREFTYTFSNNIFTGDDPFPYDDIDAVRLEHGDRTSSFTFSVYGSKGDDLYTLAEAESYAVVNMFVGAPVNRVQVNAPKAKIKLQDDPITFAGEALRSSMEILATPHYDQSVSGTPDNVIYYGPETVTLLAT